jgi:hypothetical protein
MRSQEEEISRRDAKAQRKEKREERRENGSMICKGIISGREKEGVVLV